MGQRITPNLWFNGNAKEAVDFYVSAFPEGRVLSTAYYPKSAEEGLADFQLNMAGKELTIEFELGGLRFTAINAGPEFQFNPSTSFMINFDPSRDEQLVNIWITCGARFPRTMKRSCRWTPIRSASDMAG